MNYWCSILTNKFTYLWGSPHSVIALINKLMHAVFPAPLGPSAIMPWRTRCVSNNCTTCWEYRIITDYWWHGQHKGLSIFDNTCGYMRFERYHFNTIMNIFSNDNKFHSSMQCHCIFWRLHMCKLLYFYLFHKNGANVYHLWLWCIFCDRIICSYFIHIW